MLRGAAKAFGAAAPPGSSISMSDKSVVTRIAPSPTGAMHIGTARTALFNWLYARHTGGTYLLRVEDTDRERSTEAAVQVIFDGLAWLAEIRRLATEPGHLERVTAAVTSGYRPRGWDDVSREIATLLR